MALLPVEVALGRVLALCEVLPSEAIDVLGLSTAAPRVLASDVKAVRTLPPWNNSAMDGYAVRAEDLRSPGGRLSVIATVHAGDRPSATIGAGTCARIMTGAVMPDGADTVVMQERVTVEGSSIVVNEAPKPGQHVRLRGEDVEAGAALLSAGTPLNVGALGLLWAQGLSQVLAVRRPRVAIASSGDELCDVAEEPQGRIVDTNTPVIAELVARSGGLPTILGRAPDQLDAVKALFGRGLGFDVLITVSGASVGDRDYTREAFDALGVSLDFWKVAMKPGKPLAVGRAGSTLVFGLPGNPISAMVTFAVFVVPALRKLRGLGPLPPPLPAKLAEPIRKGPELHHFVRARLERRGAELWAIPLSNQSSGALSPAVAATHLISVSAGETHVESGQLIDLIPLPWAI
jgi:molybdopterin molybdotransferase